MIVPSGSAVTADFRCRAFDTETVIDVHAKRSKMRLQLRDSFGIRAAANADPHDPAMLQHIATVEGARCFDRRDAISLSTHRNFGRGDLGPPLIGAGTADDR